MENVTHPARVLRAHFLWQEALWRAALRREQSQAAACDPYTRFRPTEDRDRDGVPDDMDNCPACFNPNQYDYDFDGWPDCCDPDDDNDRDPDPLDPNRLAAGINSYTPSYAVATYGMHAIGAAEFLTMGAVLDIRG